MPQFVIERSLPGAGSLTGEQLKTISQKSNRVLNELGPEIKWLHSYVTGNKIYCVYDAPNADIIREHAKRGEFPADSVEQVATVISPATGRA